MAKNTLKIMLSLMKEIDDKNKPSAADYDITKEEFGDIIEMCQDAGYIKGANVVRGGQGNQVLAIILDTIKLTVKGYEYLRENSAIMKLYNGVKLFKDWADLISNL